VYVSKGVGIGSSFIQVLKSKKVAEKAYQKKKDDYKIASKIIGKKMKKGLISSKL